MNVLLILLRARVAPLRAVDTWINQYRVFWTANLNNLKAFVESEYEKETETASRKQK